MITEIVSEYTKQIKLPVMSTEWAIGPLDFDQYIITLLIAKFNDFRWYSGCKPFELESIFPNFDPNPRDFIYYIHFELDSRVLNISSEGTHVVVDNDQVYDRVSKRLSLCRLLEECCHMTMN